MAEKKKKRNWIKGAIKHPGAFRRWAKARGMSMGEAIQSGKKSKNPTTHREAHLAQTLKRLRKRK